MPHISQSASLKSITKYLKLAHGLTEVEAQSQAKEVWNNLVDMRSKGYIEGWYFDEHGHLELEPSSEVLQQILGRVR
ncbi:hypothetical protein [Paraferrimonas sedimenticola]|uniref:Uncharacterized protein n=1 Tax=Paraferrimonas sedimenticola TaxID=375674 RepID=A0AA37VSP8_9GAMM|nr:hypothetical protein [Paraferrimonas sedimenticola]GLP94826.1 hypothetical protein GCM10007895_01320 [Paraferrimonas sedimenticola]